jgi:hypothetical protein
VIARASVAVALVLGCGSGAKPASEPNPRAAYAELEARLPPILDAMNRLAESIAAAPGDCPKIAAAIRSFGARYAADISDLWALRGKLTDEELDRWNHDHEEDAERFDAVLGSIGSCRADPGVEAALDTAGFSKTKSSPTASP